MQPYFRDGQLTLWHGHSGDVLTRLESGSVDCIITSPPYYGLRSYLPDDHPDKGAEIGTEATLPQYVTALAEVFREARRVLADDGTLWLNLGDSYVHRRASGPQGSTGERAERTFTAAGSGGWAGMPDKNLMGVPWRVAFALQDDGWILRNSIIWNKLNGMPASVTDRLTNRHENVFLLSKSPDYWFDLDAIREPHADSSLRRAAPHRAQPARSAREGDPYDGVAPAQTLRLDQMNHPPGRNPGDVWSLPTKPFPAAHFAVMAPELAERCLLAGCRPGGTVLDPFSGSGTTGLVAAKHGRRFVGIDLNEGYLDLSLQTRLAQPGLMWEQSA